MNHNAPSVPKLIDVANAFESSPPALDFIWPGFLAGSVGTLVAPGGTGKSFWALSAAIAVACDVPGGDILELAPSKCGRVVYLAAEDPEPVLHNRLHTIGAHLPPAARASAASRLSLISMVGSLPNVMDREWLQTIVRLAKDARLIVMDTLSRVHSLDENSNSDMAQLVARLEYLARETGAAVLYLHHVSKSAQWNKQTDQQAAARGASALVDNVRWAAHLTVMDQFDASRWAAPGDLKPIGEVRRTRFLRFGVTKQNYGPRSGVDQWYERVQGGVLVPVTLTETTSVTGNNGRRVL